MATRLISRVARLEGQRFNKITRRSLCSSQQGQGDVIGVSLAEKLPGLPAAKYAQATSHSYDTHVTTLDNGLRIASENKFGQFCTVGGFTCGRTKTTALIKEMSSLEIQKLAALMRDRPFSVATDGSNDTSGGQKYYPIVVRAACDDGVKSGLLALAKCDGQSTGKNIFQLLDDELKAHNIPWQNCLSVRSTMHQIWLATKVESLPLHKQENEGIFKSVLLNSGSRHESAYPSGIIHFLEKLSFGTTPSWEDKDKILQALEKVGGICDCQGSRDTLVYAASARTSGLDMVMKILSDVVLKPTFPDDQMDDTRQAIQFEIEAMHMDPNPEQLLMEIIHKAAYQNNSLGLPRICPEENISVITRDHLYTYMREHHTPDNAVIAGVGVEHDKLVDLAQKYFVTENKPSWLSDGELWVPRVGPQKCTSQYTGGIVQVEKDLSNVSLGPTPMPELAHIVFGLESCGHKDPDFIAFCVLNMMLGGGGSFSAGGPGKGMYTRLYLNVLNRYVWIESATAYNHAYDDSGLFCIHASAHPSKLRELAEVILRELVYTSSMVYQDELNRAKCQLQSMLMMNLEVRPVVFEDIGRQVLAGSVRKDPQFYYNQIGSITERDIQRVANRMLKSKLSVVGYGSLSGLPSYEDMEAAVLTRDGRLPSKKSFSLFRR